MQARYRATGQYLPIAEYGVIGDCHTAALIARDGSIDWLCPGGFDAPAVFCRILDAGKGGFLSLAPVDAFSVERHYRGSTNVLETNFSTARGRVRVTDLMPIHRRTEHRRGYDVGTSNRLLRLVESVEGEVELELQFKPTFDFARARATLAPHTDRGVVAWAGSQYLTLACADACFAQNQDGVLDTRLHLQSGDRRWIVLTYAADPDRANEALAPVNCDEQLFRTLEYWQHWASECTYSGPYRQEVLRSALVLKLLTYEPSGAVVAAPTTSLPEQIGGERNWDYRYTWLRDSSLILYALMTLGYGDEASDFMGWLERTVGSDPTREPQIMYGIDGRTALPEQQLEHLDGYRASRPVRIGNAAAGQRQLDIFGEVLRAAGMHYDTRSKPPAEAWALLRDLVERAATHWRDSGRGIWEVRGGPRPFLYGKLMCWAALEVGVTLATAHHLEAPVQRWRDTRAEIHAAILERGYSPEVKAFTQAFDSSVLDASALILPRIGFLPATDPRVRSTVEQVRTHLMRDGLVYRYRTSDGLSGGEGTFTLCTLWLANALALEGSVDRAREVLDGVLRFANDLGLLSEEIDPASRQQLGNFPQGFSHMALIGAAVDLADAMDNTSKERGLNEAERAYRGGGGTA